MLAGYQEGAVYSDGTWDCIGNSIRGLLLEVWENFLTAFRLAAGGDHLEETLDQAGGWIVGGEKMNPGTFPGLGGLFPFFFRLVPFLDLDWQSS
jgi:hypothetical protein